MFRISAPTLWTRDTSWWLRPRGVSERRGVVNWGSYYYFFLMMFWSKNIREGLLKNTNIGEHSFTHPQTSQPPPPSSPHHNHHRHNYPPSMYNHHHHHHFVFIQSSPNVTSRSHTHRYLAQLPVSKVKMTCTYLDCFLKGAHRSTWKALPGNMKT